MYRERLGISWPAQVECIDLVEYLADHLRIPSPQRVMDHGTAYVDPTHAVRFPNRFDAARMLSKAALGSTPLELFWRRERAHPVGSTAIQITRPDIGIRLTEARIEDALSRGAQTILCDDPATLHELRLRNQSRIRIEGLYEMLLTRLNREG